MSEDLTLETVLFEVELPERLAEAVEQRREDAEVVVRLSDDE
jgi:hypothetical protein